jgi:hypothetical protein
MYKAYFDAELSLPQSAKDSYLSVAGYYTDIIENQDNAANPRIIKRRALFANGVTA